MMQRSLVLVKPDGVQRGLVGEVIKRLEQRGLKIIGLKMVWVDEAFAKKHYKAHVGKPFFESLVNFIDEGPVVAIVIEGVRAISIVRKIVGPTSPEDAMPGTIRGDFAHISMEYADKSGMGGRNLIHASGNEKEAKYELRLWFKKKELHSYSRSGEWHTMGLKK